MPGTEQTLYSRCCICKDMLQDLSYVQRDLMHTSPGAICSICFDAVRTITDTRVAISGAQ